MVRGLLTTDGFTLRGPLLLHRRAPRCTRARCSQPHPPIWIGASGERRMMPIAARYADVWHSYGPPEMMREKSARLSRMALEGGRDPVEITRASSLSLEDDLDTHRPRSSTSGTTPDSSTSCAAGRAAAGAQIAAFASRFLTPSSPAADRTAARRARLRSAERSCRSASAAAAPPPRMESRPSRSRPGCGGVAQQERDRGARVRRAVGVREVEHRRVGMIRRQVADHPHRAPRHAARRAHRGDGRRLHVERARRRRRRARRHAPGSTRNSSELDTTPSSSPASGVASYRVPLLRSTRPPGAARRRRASSPMPPAMPTTSTWSTLEVSSSRSVAAVASASPIPVRIATTSTAPTRPTWSTDASRRRAVSPIVFTTGASSLGMGVSTPTRRTVPSMPQPRGSARRRPSAGAAIGRPRAGRATMARMASRGWVVTVALVLTLAACGSDGSDTAARPAPPPGPRRLATASSCAAPTRSTRPTPRESRPTADRLDPLGHRRCSRHADRDRRGRAPR